MAWPTTDDPRTVFVTIRLTESEADDLDALCAASGASRSNTVRLALEQMVTSSKRRSRRKRGMSDANDAGA